MYGLVDVGKVVETHKPIERQAAVAKQLGEIRNKTLHVGITQHHATNAATKA